MTWNKKPFLSQHQDTQGCISVPGEKTSGESSKQEHGRMKYLNKLEMKVRLGKGCGCLKCESVSTLCFLHLVSGPLQASSCLRHMGGNYFKT